VSRPHSLLPLLVVLALAVGPLARAQAPPAPGKAARPDAYGDPLPTGAAFRVGTVRLRHADRLSGIALTPDSKTVVSASRFEVRLWDRATGRLLRTLPAVWRGDAFVLSADGKTIFAQEKEEGLALYETATGKPLVKLPNDLSWSLASSDNKGFVVFLGLSDKMTQSDVLTGKKLGEWSIDEKEWPRAVAPDRSLLVTGVSPDSRKDRADTLRLRDVAAGKMVRELKVPCKDFLFGVAFAPRDQALVTFGDDGLIRVFDSATGKEVRKWEAAAAGSGHSSLRDGVAPTGQGLFFSPDGKMLATVGGDATLRLWDWATGKELRHFRKVSGPVAFSADGKVIAAGGDDDSVRLWDAATGRDLSPLGEHPGRVTDAVFSPDGGRLAVGSSEDRMHLLDPDSGRELRRFSAYRPCLFSADGRSLVTTHWDRETGEEAFALHEAATGKELARFQIDGANRPQQRSWSAGGRLEAAAAGLSADGKLLVTAGGGPWDGEPIRAWDAATGKKLREFAGASGACSPDGRRAAVQAADGVVRLFDAATGKEIHSLPGIGKAGDPDDRLAPFVAFSADGKLLVAAGPKNVFRIADTATGKEITRVEGRRQRYVRPQPLFSPDGSLLLLDVDGDEVDVVETATGRRVCSLIRDQSGEKSHQTPDVDCRAVSPDNRFVASAHFHHWLILWETLSGKPIRSWHAHEGDMKKLVFAPDGRRLVSLNEDGTALAWDLTGRLWDDPRPKDLGQAWDDLGEADAARAHRAVRALAEAGDRGAALLGERVRPAPTAGPERLKRLIADLDRDDSAVRDRATAELATLGEVAEAALRRALADPASAEMRVRAEGLLGQLAVPNRSPERLRLLRAVAALEHAGTPAARQVLRALAEGAANHRLTREAKASLDRLSKAAVKP